jgi:hypothetical protein
MSKVQYKIEMYDKNLQQTFTHKFYIEEDACFITVLRQLLDILKDYNLEIDAKTMTAFIIGNRNPKETHIIMERIN